MTRLFLATRCWRVIILLFLPAGLLAGGCQRSAGPDLPPDNRLVVALESAPINLDPRVGTDQASSRVFEVMLNGLVTKDTRGNLLPDLAESWEILDGGERYRFHLRPGVRFHDGRELSSADVIWTFQSILDGTVVSPKRGAFQRLERVEAVDDLTVDFVMSEPFGAMLVNLTSFLGIIPQGMDTVRGFRGPLARTPTTRHPGAPGDSRRHGTRPRAAERLGAAGRQ
jgi:peptide/nickel transport system substrate-binding protein